MAFLPRLTQVAVVSFLLFGKALSKLFAGRKKMYAHTKTGEKALTF